MIHLLSATNVSSESKKLAKTIIARRISHPRTRSKALLVGRASEFAKKKENLALMVDSHPHLPHTIDRKNIMIILEDCLLFFFSFRSLKTF